MKMDIGAPPAPTTPGVSPFSYQVSHTKKQRRVKRLAEQDTGLHRLRNAMRQSVAENLNVAELAILISLSERSKTVTELSKDFNLTYSSVAHRIRSLAGDDLVVWEMGNNKPIKITGMGTKALKRVLNV